MLTAPLPLRAETRRLGRECVSGWAAARPARGARGRGPASDSLRISRYDESDNPAPDPGAYLFSVAPDDARHLARNRRRCRRPGGVSYEVPPSAWTPPLAAA